MEKVFTNITHELLTPLTVVSASVDQLREESTEHDHQYDMMQMNIQRMVRLLQQILETSKSQAGELKLQVAYGDVMKYIYDTALCLQPLMTKKGIDFNIKCTPESMMGWIDTDKLDKIIYNLISNAAKYTSEGEISLEVQTSRNYDFIFITVRDTGCGIPQDKQKHLFQRFYDGEYRHHNNIGTGLGLALTRDLVVLHHGNISFKSEKDKGTTFTVILPITKEAFSPKERDEEHRIDLNIAKNAIVDIKTEVPDINKSTFVSATDDDEKSNILISEDNPELLMLMYQALKSQYHVFVAQSGKQALDIIHKTRIHLIVSDIMMADMDGLQLTETIKSDPVYSHLPIILITANTQEESREEALRIGADEYLTKPFRLGDLKLRIENIIANRKRTIQDSQGQATEPVADLPPTPEQEFLKRALDCLREHLDDADYDRDTFAADMGASASSLYNKLRAITGMNVSTFIRDARMKEAKRLAEANPNMRVSDLAYRVGFQDPKYFSTCFKKQFGIQPKEFMENLQPKK
ncbi:MAG: response regulator [Prevotella sp.]|nr:response regulator [Prevotella sp.]